MADAEIHVGSNRPRLLDPGAPPPPAQLGSEPDVLAAPAPYWTADKAARVVAEGGKALSKLYGPDSRLSGVEVDLVGQPLANVLNDWVVLPSGPQGDRMANLLGLAAVLALLVALRLPDILDAHDMLPGWTWVRRQRERARAARQPGELEVAAPAAPAPRPAAVEASPIAPVQERPEKAWDKFAPTTIGSGFRAEAG